MNGIALATQPRPPSEIRNQLDFQSEQLKGLLLDLKNLQERLTPVTRQVPSPESKSGGDKPPADSHLGQSIMDHTHMIQEARATVTELFSTLAI